MPPLSRYHMPSDDFEEVVLEPVVPVKPPEGWMTFTTQRNLEALEEIHAGLVKLESNWAHELMLVIVNMELFRPKDPA